MRPGVSAPRVVVAGGYSAGHIEPTMNLADVLRRLEPTAQITVSVASGLLWRIEFKLH